MSDKRIQEIMWENYPDLLWIANTEAGKKLLGCEIEGRVVKLTPNSYHIKQGKLIVARFHCDNKVAAILLPLIEKVKIYKEYKHIIDPYKSVLHFSGLETQRGYPTIALDTITFSPNAGGSGSGRIQSAFSNSWGNTVAGNGLGGNSLTLVTSISQLSASFSGGTYTLDRIWHPFQTSSINSEATIVSSFIRYVGTADNNNSDDVFLSPVQSVQSSFTTLATSDWNNIGSILYGGFTKALWNQSGNNDVILNSNGIANINMTGYSGFACRVDRDVSGTQPTGVNIFGISSVETIVLSVTYTLPTSASSYSYFM